MHPEKEFQECKGASNGNSFLVDSTHVIKFPRRVTLGRLLRQVQRFLSDWPNALKSFGRASKTIWQVWDWKACL